jgi:hypothetical protein
MKAKDIVQITTVAAGTATLTVAIFLASPLDAQNETDPIGATVPDPKLVCQGVEFTVTPVEGSRLKAGDQPEFRLQAVNTMGTPSEVTIRFAMTGSAPVSPFSRMMPMPTLLWQQECTLTLQANETKSMNLATQTILPENTVVSVALAEIDEKDKTTHPDTAVAILTPQLMPAMGGGVVVLSFSTAEPKADPAFAAAP